MSVAEINAVGASLEAAIDAESWADVRKYALKLTAVLARTPDSTFSDNTKLEWQRRAETALELAKEVIKEQADEQSGGRGIRRQGITYTRVTS